MGCCGDTPDIPDPAKAAQDAVFTDVSTLPQRRLIDAAAKTGGKVTIGGKVYDFTGLGDADVAKQYADAMAAATLANQKEFGDKQIQQRLDELKLSDPEGVATRQRLYDQIVGDLNKQPDRPTADSLQQSILDDLNKGATLDPEVQRQLSQQVRGGQVARGNFLGNAATGQEVQALTKAGEDQRAQRQQRAITFLSSGETPEDVAYRRNQQGESNLGSFLTGQTPTAQFGQLAGAQNQAVPFYNYGTGQQTNPNAGAQGNQFANSVYSSQANLYANQVNPWMAGLSTGVGAYNAATAFSQPAYQGQGVTPSMQTAGQAALNSGGGGGYDWSLGG